MDRARARAAFCEAGDRPRRAGGRMTLVEESVTGDTAVTPTLRSTARRVVFWVVISIVALLIVLLIAALSRNATVGEPLAADNAAPGSSMALGRGAEAAGCLRHRDQLPRRDRGCGGHRRRDHDPALRPGLVPRRRPARGPRRLRRPARDRRPNFDILQTLAPESPARGSSRVRSRRTATCPAVERAEGGPPATWWATGSSTRLPMRSAASAATTTSSPWFRSTSTSRSSAPSAPSPTARSRRTATPPRAQPPRRAQPPDLGTCRASPTSTPGGTAARRPRRSSPRCRAPGARRDRRGVLARAPARATRHREPARHGTRERDDARPRPPLREVERPCAGARCAPRRKHPADRQAPAALSRHASLDEIVNAATQHSRDGPPPTSAGCWSTTCRPPTPTWCAGRMSF